ncbi:hypothetical protein CUR178_07192 [Leishmania enriettii]|uniref:Surface antigen-like protein n=1 Tax=Leishmania enriettii TaxID=5663 RepID=A0A836HUQ0_LEIEN|nr:hypothetical protein CUR178_07187 [Leishmania enriettii]KAG5484601.1 hypothetical protein CUR178_07192 [Leishmania enriettii]
MEALKSVKIANTSASGKLPEWATATLTTIDLSSNEMGGTLAASWAEMANLATVDITGNCFCGCVPESRKRKDVLESAVAKIGGKLIADDCAISNVCTGESEKCPEKGNAVTGPTQTAAATALLCVAAGVAAALAL